MFDTTDLVSQPAQGKSPSILSALKYGFTAYTKNFLRLMLVVLAIGLAGYCYELLCELLAGMCGIDTDIIDLTLDGSFTQLSSIVHPRILLFAWMELLLATIALQIHDTGTFSFNVFYIPWRAFMRAVGATFLLAAIIVLPFGMCTLSFVLLPKVIGWSLLIAVVLAIAYFLIKCSFYMYFIADGHATLIDSFCNSFTITRQYWWRAGILLVSTRLITQIYFLFFLLPIQSLAYAYVYRRLSKRADNHRAGPQFDAVL
jgi:hypothetical protein